MSNTAEVKVHLTSEAKLAALDAYQARLKTVNATVGSLRASLAGLGAALGMGAVFSSASQSLNQLSSEIERSGGRVGLGAEGYQVLGQALKSAGGNADDLTAALGTLRNALGEAVGDGKSGVAKSLGELGLRAQELTTLRPEVQLERVARALAGIEDPARRAALAQDILGKGATAIKPLLDRLAVDGYGKLRQEAATTVGILSDDLATAIDDVGDRAENAGQRAAKGLAPLVLAAGEAKASIAEMFADLANMEFSPGAGLAVGGAAALGIGAAMASPAQWGMVAGMAAAKASAASVPVWMGVGALIAAGFLGAKGIQAWRDKAIKDIEAQDARRAAPLKASGELWKSVNTISSEDDIAAIIAQAERAIADSRAKLAAKETSTINLGRGPSATVTTNVVADLPERQNIEMAIASYSELIAMLRNVGAERAKANAERDARARAESDAAARERKAAEWVSKNETSIEQRVADQTRARDMAALAPAERLRQLEAERTSILAANDQFEGAVHERRKADLVTMQRVSDIDDQIVATKKEIATETERAAAASQRMADEAKRYMEEHRKAAAMAKDQSIGDRLGDLSVQDASNQADYSLTDVEKRARRQDNLRQQQALAKEGEKFHASRGDLDAAHRYRKQSDQIGAEIARDQAGTPETAMQGVAAGLTQLQTQWGTLAHQMMRSVADIGSSISSSIGGALNGVLGTTADWSARLGNIAGPIMGAVTQSISRMFAEWIVARGAAALKNILFSQKEGAADLAAKTPGALATSISSFGVAAAVGVAAFIAATALAGGFATGGYTGGNNAKAPAGVVHQGEWVAPKWMVDDPRYSEMISTLEAIRKGQPGYSLGGMVKYAGIPNFLRTKQINKFVESYNLVDGKKYYPSAVGQDATFDPASQSWIQNPDQSVAVPSALTPGASFASGRDGGSADTETGIEQKPLRIVILDDTRKSDLDRLVADPRFQTQVVRISQKNSDRIFGGNIS